MAKGGDATARPTDADRIPRPTLWVTALTVALLAIGFRQDRRAHSRNPAATAIAEAHGAPRSLPSRGLAIWKKRLARLHRRIVQDRVTAIAAGVTYFSLLSVFPAVAALVALYGLFADPATVDDHLGAVTGVVPGGGMDIIRDQMNRVAAEGGGKLGLAFAVGLGLSLWSANAATKAMFDALNIVYDAEEKRSFFVLNGMSLLFTVGGIVFLLVAVGAVVALPMAFAYIGFGGLWETLVSLGRWPILVCAIMLILVLVYRYGPSRTAPRRQWFTWGNAFAAFAWLAVSALFSWYAANFASYNKTYGSLGAVIGFMTWMWISANVVLVGAEIDAELEREAADDAPTRS